MIITARRKELLDRTAEKCRTAGAKDVHALALDLTEDADLEALVHVMHESFGSVGLDYMYLVHAKISYAFFSEHLTLEEVNNGILASMRTNFDSSVKLTHLALPLLEKAKGRIIGIGTLGVFFGQAMMSGYLVSISLTHCGVAFIVACNGIFVIDF